MLQQEIDFYEIESQREQLEFLLEYAILAPSGHNSQPWVFRIADDGVEVYADYSRRVPIADPGDRELLMSIGAAITNLRVAAAHYGIETSVLYQPVFDEALAMAMVTMRETCAPDERLARLFPAIPLRRTNRGKFMQRPVDIKTLTELFDLMSEFPQSLRLVLPQDKQRVVRLVEEANREQWARVEFREELADWMRGHGAADGLLAPPLAPWVVRTFDVGPARARAPRPRAGRGRRGADRGDRGRRSRLARAGRRSVGARPADHHSVRAAVLVLQPGHGSRQSPPPAVGPPRIAPAAAGAAAHRTRAAPAAGNAAAEVGGGTAVGKRSKPRRTVQRRVRRAVIASAA